MGEGATRDVGLGLGVGEVVGAASHLHVRQRSCVCHMRGGCIKQVQALEGVGIYGHCQ